MTRNFFITPIPLLLIFLLWALVRNTWHGAESCQIQGHVGHWAPTLPLCLTIHKSSISLSSPLQSQGSFRPLPVWLFMSAFQPSWLLRGKTALDCQDRRGKKLASYCKLQYESSLHSGYLVSVERGESRSSVWVSFSQWGRPDIHLISKALIPPPPFFAGPIELSQPATIPGFFQTIIPDFCSIGAIQG